MKLTIIIANKVFYFEILFQQKNKLFNIEILFYFYKFVIYRYFTDFGLAKYDKCTNIRLQYLLRW